MNYKIHEYYKAKNSDKYYFIDQQYDLDTKAYTIYCYKNMTLYEPIGFFRSHDLAFTRTILHRLLNAGPDEKLVFSQDYHNQLVDLNLMEVK